ncbi:hypothetical protein Moror_16587, partial [Moniliophthora roreri MCA 2997]
ISGSLSLISSANAIIRRRRYPWIATTSHHKLSTKVADHDYDVAKVSCSRLDIDIDTLATFSSYPRFQPQPAAPEYTGMTFLAHIGSQNSFLASAESADAVFTSQWKSLPPTNIPTFASVPDHFVIISTSLQRLGRDVDAWVTWLWDQESILSLFCISIAIDPPAS